MQTGLCRMRTESLVAPSPALRETVFGRQRQKAEKDPMAPSASDRDRHTRQLSREKARKIGTIRQRQGNAGSYWNAWWWFGDGFDLGCVPLITGKITGNFAESGLSMRFSSLIHERIQELGAKFPTQRNREFF